MIIKTNKFLLYSIIVVLMVATTLPSISQRFELGLRFMPTLSSFEVYTPGDGRVVGDLTFGMGYGGLVGFSISDNFGIQGEVIYSSIAQKYKENDIERRVNLKYLNIPLLLSLNTGKTKAVNLNIVGGPQLGVSVGSRITTSGGDGNNPEAILSVKKGDLGLAYGAGVDFGLNPSQTIRLGLGFRGVYGLIDISDNSNSTTTNSYYVLERTHVKTYSAYVGISFLL